MADAFTVIRYPNESLKDFNNRLRKMCEDAPVTSFEAAVVDEQLAITLICESQEATEEDITQEREVDPKTTLSVGDLIPSGPTIMIQATTLRAHTPDAAAKSENLFEKLVSRLGADVEQVRYVQAPTEVWIPDLSKAKRRSDGSLELDKDDQPQSVDGSPLAYVLAHRQCTYLIISAPLMDDEQAEGGDE